MRWTWANEERLPLLAVLDHCEEVVRACRNVGDDYVSRKKSYSSYSSVRKLEDIQRTLAGSPVVSVPVVVLMCQQALARMC